MEEIIKEKYNTVICQPTHIMHGIEYEKNDKYNRTL